MKKFFRYFDYYAFLLALSISGIGILAIWSSASASGRDRLARAQMEWIGLGCVAMLAALVIDYRRLANFAALLYAVTTAVLMVILVYGQIRKGAQRWLAIGPFSLQPSELAKFTLALVLAKYVASVKGKHLTFVELCIMGALAGAPMALIALQPDMGTAITFIPIAAALAFMGGIRVRYYVILVVVLAIAIPTVYKFGLREYQRERIHTFLDPNSDPQDAGWQIRQARIAVGSGGLLGKGYLQGSQTRLQFVPEQHTDFIFTVWAEEIGFLGTGVAIALYILLTTRVLGTAALSRDWLGALICAGFAGSLSFQAMANLCMVISIIPTTGIPLPLMSYGGTSLLTTFLFLGLTMNVRMRRFDIW